MLIFTLAISCLTTSNLSWFMDLTFQVPMQYRSLHHQNLLPSPVTSTTGCCVYFGSFSSFFLELFLYCYPVVLGTYWPGEFIFQCPIFLPFILFMGSQGKNTEVVCHSILQWTTFVRTLQHDPSVLGGPTRHDSWFLWVRQGCGPCDQFDYLVFCDCGFQSVCPLMDKGKRLMEASWWDWLWGKLGLFLMGGAMLSKSLIQFSVDGWGCVLFLLFDLRSNYDGGNEDNGDLLQKVPCTHCCTQCPWLCNRPPLTHASAGNSWTLMGKSGSVSCWISAPFSWVLVHTRFFFLSPPKVCFPNPM